MKLNVRNNSRRYILLLLVLILSLAPLMLLFINAVKPSTEFLSNPFGLPSKFAFGNIKDAWIQGQYGTAFLNSILVGVATIAIVSVFGGLCAYSLAKLPFRGSSLVMTYFILAMSVPLGLFLVPLFFIWQKLHLMNTLQGLILIYSAIYLPFNIFFLRSFFVGIPNALRESALIDGCGEMQVFWKIMFPLAKPAFLTVDLLVALWTWNEFFFANAFIQSDSLKTVSTKYLVFTGQFSSDWTKISAAGLIAIVPILIIYFFFQRNFIEGLTAGSIKG
jgi:raffinose/stachyose/melibiose transport system permease protein